MGWILILSCANGRVGFISRRADISTGKWVCMNDATEFIWPRDDMAADIVVLDAMLAKAIALKGAVTHVFLIPQL